MKGKFFNELYSFASSMVPPNDFMLHQRLQDIVKTKNQQEQNINGLGNINLSSIITEKEKLQIDLEKALNEIDKLKTLVAENTI